MRDGQSHCFRVVAAGQSGDQDPRMSSASCSEFVFDREGVPKKGRSTSALAQGQRTFGGINAHRLKGGR